MSTCVCSSVHCLGLVIKTELEVPFCKILLPVQINFFYIRKIFLYLIKLETLSVGIPRNW